MATQYKDDRIFSISGAVDTAPDRKTALTGTLTSSGKFVTGTGTLFLSEIGGDGGVGQSAKDFNAWLFNGTNEVRRITAIANDTHLTIEEGFTVDLAGASAYVILVTGAVMVSILAVGAITVDGVALADTVSATYGYSAPAPFTLDPLIVDPLSGSATVTVTWQSVL